MKANLMPDSTDNRAEQYEFAWKSLLDETVPEKDRCHARCWLTYRVLDGEIKPDDWLEKIEPVKPATEAIRWRSSIPLADAYVWFLVLNDRDAMLRCLAESREAIVSRLEKHPGGALNFLRVSALLAYQELIHGNKDAGAKMIRDAVQVWQNMWPSFEPELKPFRFAEMRGDCVVLHAMLRMLQRFDAVEGAFPPAKWADLLLDTERHHPWWRVMLKIPMSPHAMFDPVVTPSLVHQYQQVHAAKPHYGSGPGEQERETIRAAIVEAIGEPNSVLDYGCGNSRLASQMFPVASMLCRYDPAIERLSRLPDLRFEVGICTDVLEHVPESELGGLVTRFKTLAPTWYFTIHTGPAAQILPEGQNAHCTQHPPKWWQELLGGKIVWQKGQRFGLLVTW